MQILRQLTQNTKSSYAAKFVKTAYKDISEKDTRGRLTTYLFAFNKPTYYRYLKNVSGRVEGRQLVRVSLHTNPRVESEGEQVVDNLEPETNG
jgi:hypothetical protein